MGLSQRARLPSAARRRGLSRWETKPAATPNHQPDTCLLCTSSELLGRSQRPPPQSHWAPGGAQTPAPPLLDQAGGGRLPRRSRVPWASPLGSGVGSNGRMTQEEPKEQKAAATWELGQRCGPSSTPRGSVLTWRWPGPACSGLQLGLVLTMPAARDGVPRDRKSLPPISVSSHSAD